MSAFIRWLYGALNDFFDASISNIKDIGTVQKSYATNHFFKFVQESDVVAKFDTAVQLSVYTQCIAEKGGIREKCLGRELVKRVSDPNYLRKSNIFICAH